MTKWFSISGPLSDREESVYALLCRYYDDRPLRSREIYEACGMPGDHETAKRGVRAIVSRLRKRGAPVCANLADGYWLARDAGEFDSWRRAESSKAVFKFVMLRETAGAVGDGAAGQGKLFGGDAPSGVDAFRR